MRNREDSHCGCVGGGEECAGHLKEICADIYCIDLLTAHDLLVILWKISVVVISHRCNTPKFNRAVALSVFAAVNKLQFHELPFHVFSWHEQALAENTIKILSCFRKMLLFVK